MSNESLLRLIARLTLACLLLPGAHCLLPAAFAQSATATLSGTVVDQKGAVVPDASVTIVNDSTRSQRKATTNDRGDFTIPLLPPSTYTVTVERQGFAPVQIDNVVLNVADQKSLQIELKAGNITEMVKIEGAAPLINESPAVGTVVDRQFVANLPLNGRSFQSLIALTPGVILTKPSDGTGGQFSVNGQRSNANYFTVDGVSANIGIDFARLLSSGGGTAPGLSASGGTNNLVSVDALQEFRIQTSTYAPEFGRQPGGQVQIASRSGTRGFHGTLFNYFRNEAMDANDWFANANRLHRPPLRQNDFGGVIGGPVLLPRFGEGGTQPGYDGRNRTFFFFSYEGLRLRLPQVAVTTVPSLAARAAAPPQIKPLLDAFPLPNGQIFSNGLAQFSASYATQSTLDATSLRIDHIVNQKFTVFGRYNYSPSEDIQRRTASLSHLAISPVKTKTLTLGATHVITASLSNELRFNHSTNTGAQFNKLDNFGGAIPLSITALLPSFASAEESLAGAFLLSGPGFALGKNSFNEQRQINVVDNLSMVQGSHQLKFGVDYRRLVPLFDPPRYFPTYFFADIASMLAGRTSSVSITAFRPSDRLLITNLSLYAQDTWKARQRLTLTYGLRWELNPAPSYDGEPKLLAISGADDPATITLAPPGTPIYRTTYNNFAPRFGVAYQLRQAGNWETVLRGGIGIFYDLGIGSSATAIAVFPYSTNKQVNNAQFPLSTSNAQPIPFPSIPLSLPVTSRLFATDPNLKLPRTYQWNATVEQSLGAHQTLSLAYVGAVGRELQRLETVPPNGNFPGALSLRRNTGTSDYHALQLQFNRRLSRGIQGLASYTWSHSIDTGSSDNVLITPSERIDPQRDRGPSDFDVRHVFSAALTYDIPAPSLGEIGTAILRRWSLDTIFRAQTATPFDVFYSRNIGFGGAFSLRPDLVPGMPLYVDDPAVGGGRRVNRAAFVIPVEARQGNLGRNVLRGFPMWQVDFGVRRQINLTERVNLQLKAEAFNLFNHPNFGDPIGTLTNNLFGRSTQMLGRSIGRGLVGGFSPLYQVGGPRSIQLALKLQF